MGNQNPQNEVRKEAWQQVSRLLYNMDDESDAKCVPSRVTERHSQSVAIVPGAICGHQDVASSARWTSQVGSFVGYLAVFFGGWQQDSNPHLQEFAWTSDNEPPCLFVTINGREKKEVWLQERCKFAANSNAAASCCPDARTVISTTFFGRAICHLWLPKVLFTTVWGRDGLSRHKIIRLLPFPSENRCRMSLASGNGARSWNAIWSRLFKAREYVGEDVDSENLLTCYLLHWTELKCTFRLLIQTLKHELAKFASVEGLKMSNDRVLQKRFSTGGSWHQRVSETCFKWVTHFLMIK